MPPRMMRQFKLQSGTTVTTAWLDDDPRVKLHSRVTLKDSDEPKRWWVVIERGDNTRHKSTLEKSWNVGGVEVGRRRR